MCVFVDAYVYVYVYVYVYAYAYVYVSVYVYECMSAYAMYCNVCKCSVMFANVLWRNSRDVM